MDSGYDNFYIEHDIYKDGRYHSATGRKARPKKIGIYKEIEENKIVFLQGDMGIGKSKLLREIAKKYCNYESYVETETVPVFVKYTSFMNDYSCNIDELLFDAVGEKVLDNKAAKFLILN